MSHLWGVNTGDPDTLIDGVYWCPGPVPVAHHEGLVVLDQVATLHPLQENYEARLRSRDATLLALHCSRHLAEKRSFSVLTPFTKVVQN